MIIDGINITSLRRNNELVWTEASGLPYPTEWSLVKPAKFDLGVALAEQVKKVSRAHDDVPMRIGQPVKARALPTAQGGTKKDQAIAIYRNMIAEGKFKADIIVAFCDQLQMSEAGATTYYYTAKKAVG